MDSHKENTKLSVRNQYRFKKSSNLLREKTMLKKALELSILCDNEICVLHYDREGNLINTLPEDQSQVRDILQRYNNLSDGEKIKKNNNLSQFFNKKLIDEKKRSLTNADERKKFTNKVGEFKSSLEDKLLVLKDRARDLLNYSHDHHQTDQNPCLAVMSEQNLNFQAPSGFFFPNDLFTSSPLMNFSPHDLDQQQQIGSFTDLLMSGDLVSEQYLSHAVYNSAAASASSTDSSNHQSKFSVFVFNHETSTFTQLPNSVSSSFDQGLTGTPTSYY